MMFQHSAVSVDSQHSIVGSMFKYGEQMAMYQVNTIFTVYLCLALL